MRISHRLRLAAVACASTGAVLALVFSGTVVAARSIAFAQRRTEIVSALNVFTLDPAEAFDLREFREANPSLSVAIFGPSRRLAEGPISLRPVLGFEREGNHISAGKPFRGETIVVGADLRESRRGADLLAAVLALLWAPLTLLVGAATYLAARAVFRPLQRLSAQAEASAGSNLGERLETDDQAEFGEFARRLNGMLERIEESARRGERFSADAAHELRTPLAILRMRLETALLMPRSPETYADTIGRAVEEIDRLSRLAEALLRTARGEVELATPINLKPCAEEAIARWQARFGASDVALLAHLENAWASILPEEARIVIDNLLENALRFSPPGSTVKVSLVSGPDASLAVRDEGPGVPPELGERIFERFVRADDSRNRASGGSGIGLAVCQRIVGSRGGRMILSTSPEGGAEVGFRLPSTHS